MQFHEFDWLSGHGIYHARQLVTIKLFCGGSCKAKIKDLAILKQLFHSSWNNFLVW